MKKEDPKNNERAAALSILLAVLEQGAFLNRATEQELRKHPAFSKQERAFVTRLTTGTVERMLTIDHILNAYSRLPVKKMKPQIRNILRMGVYQLYYMDQVPPSAAVNEAVKLAVLKGCGGLKGYVNGVLRSIARREKEIDLSTIELRFSIPAWIIEEVRQVCGDAAGEMADSTGQSMGNQPEGMPAAQNTDPRLTQILTALTAEKSLTIRANMAAVTPETLVRELTEEGVTVRPLSLPYAFSVGNIDTVGALSAFQKGHFYVQDLSSMEVVEHAGIRAGDRILDVCAAPGGKALHAAERLMVLEGGEVTRLDEPVAAETGEVTKSKETSGTATTPFSVTARDLTEQKVFRIRENIARSGLKNITAEVWDATKPKDEDKGAYDIVLADLPCSGLGILAKKPEIRYRVKPEDIRSLQKLQREILHVVKDYVKPGGTLVYSTCTMTRAENTDNVAWFLETYPNFTLQEQKQILPDGTCDGFFYAKLRRTS